MFDLGVRQEHELVFPLAERNRAASYSYASAGAGFASAPTPWRAVRLAAWTAVKKTAPA
jgi:hypothetical protein